MVEKKQIILINKYVMPKTLKKINFVDEFNYASCISGQALFW